MADAPVVPARVRALATQVGDPAPMRRGSLTERYVDALDGGGGRRHHRPAVLQAERPVRALLGAAVSGRRVRSSHNPDVRSFVGPMLSPSRRGARCCGGC